MSPVLRRHDQLVLQPNGVPARAYPWAGDRLAAQLILLDPSVVPMADHFIDWSRQFAAQGIVLMRTGALSSRPAAQAEAAGMHCIQELTLLEARPPLTARNGAHKPTIDTRRCRVGRFGQDEFDTLADVDQAAFGKLWRLDATALADVCTATPSYRARVVRVPVPGTNAVFRRPPPVGFLLSGRSGRVGYIQRLAVDPSFHRRGIATVLLGDALTWMRRSRAEQVFVNTHVDNVAALTLYHAHGFADLSERLRVFEGSTPL